MNMAGMPQTDDWRNPERRQTVVRRIAEAVQQFPEVLNRNPSEVEEAIYSKSNDKESYVNMVGRVLLSIKNKGQQLMERGMQPHMGGVGAGMMGYRPRMHPDPSYHPQQHPGMHMGGGGGPPPGMSMGMGGPPHPHMMNNTQGYPRIGMMPGNPMMSGPAHHPPMMAMGPPRPGMNAMYPGGRMPIGPTMGGMVHRVPGTMVTPMPGPGPNSDGVQSVTALPNPSFNQMGGANVTDQQPSLMQQNTSVNPHFNPASSQHQTHPSQPQMPPPTGAPQQPGVHPAAPNTQVPSPAPKQPPQAPSPHPMPMPSPSTPWNPSSPAHAPSPSQQPAHPEANSAVLTKLQELQPYVPLLARMMDRIEKGLQGDDKTKNEQWVKLNSLYNVIQSKNIKVPLQTLEKCHTALEGLFNKKDPTSVSAPSPAMSNISAASPATNTSQIKTSNPPSIKAPPISPKAPVPPSPPITSPSRNLHDFSSLSSPRPLSSQLQATFCPDEDPLDRLPPEKKAKLDEQASRSFILGLRREILRLRNFRVKQVEQAEENGSLDKAVVLDCNLASEGLPSVPPILIKVPQDYPNTSPECLIPEYQTESCTDFNRKVGKLLMNQLCSCEYNYSVTHILDVWEGSVLEVVSRELEEVSE